MSNNSNCGCHKEGKGEHNSHTGCGCHEGQKTAVNNQWASPASEKSEIENKKRVSFVKFLSKISKETLFLVYCAT